MGLAGASARARARANMTKLAASQNLKSARAACSKCRRVALKLITHHGNAVRNVPLMQGLRGERHNFSATRGNAEARRLSRCDKRFDSPSRSPATTIVPPMLGLSVIDLREGKVMAVFLPFSLVPAFIIRARTKRGARRTRYRPARDICLAEANNDRS